ncbi:hydroxyacyl dehydrogenase [Penicillium angulare]|uniref:hydroxyacyl dehydrogenase n=1 Tax=Penicillium angulare TaxID=116970 RepID=UPI0025423114|nr:hydroxyacyl dehydrogenase [Penicillium angulare]KAJ5273010.1 hydroxyacyl dehydrogenase [Penicillium angulare]
MKTSSKKKVISISLANARQVAYAPCPLYKISKAALNALMWMKSDMDGQEADLTVSQGAEAVLKVVMSATGQDNGSFKNIFIPGWDKYDGKYSEW